VLGAAALCIVPVAVSAPDDSDAIESVNLEATRKEGCGPVGCILCLHPQSVWQVQRTHTVSWQLAWLKISRADHQLFASSHWELQKVWEGMVY
jgi:hypothetical protein